MAPGPALLGPTLSGPPPAPPQAPPLPAPRPAPPEAAARAALAQGPFSDPALLTSSSLAHVVAHHSIAKVVEDAGLAQATARLHGLQVAGQPVGVAWRVELRKLNPGRMRLSARDGRRCRWLALDGEVVEAHFVHERQHIAAQRARAPLPPAGKGPSAMPASFRCSSRPRPPWSAVEEGQVRREVGITARRPVQGAWPCASPDPVGSKRD